MKVFNSLWFKITAAAFVIVLFSNTQCKHRSDYLGPEPPTYKSVDFWSSDSSASYPIIVTFSPNPSSNDKRIIDRKVSGFDCTKSTDSSFANAFASHSDDVRSNFQYSARDQKGKKWSGNITPSNNGCYSIEFTRENVNRAGAFFFSRLTNITYPIQVTITDLGNGTLMGKSDRNLTCDSVFITNQPYFWLCVDTAGTFTYHAVAASGEKWDHDITLVTNHCAAFELTGDTTAVKCTQNNMNGTWIRQDDGLYPHTKGMKISYTQATGGVVDSIPSQCCYKVIDPIWGPLQTANCTLGELVYNGSCVLTGSMNVPVIFISINLISVNGVQYKRTK